MQIKELIYKQAKSLSKNRQGSGDIQGKPETELRSGTAWTVRKEAITV